MYHKKYANMLFVFILLYCDGFKKKKTYVMCLQNECFSYIFYILLKNILGIYKINSISIDGK